MVARGVGVLALNQLRDITSSFIEKIEKLILTNSDGTEIVLE